MYGRLEHDADILYTKNDVRYGLITISLDKNAKPNFIEKSIANKSRAQVVIFKQALLSKAFIEFLKKGTTVLLKGELIKTPSFERANFLFSRDDIKALNSDFLLFIGDTSNIFVLNMPKGKERENLDLHMANSINFNLNKQTRNHYETQNN
jgi:hypothetical protein